MTATFSDRAGPPLVIRLFSAFEVCRDGTPLPTLRTRKGQWLLALLVLRAGQEVERTWLAGTLWPDSSEAQALANLRNSLTDLRGALGSEEARLRSPTPHTLCLDLARAEVDVAAFDAALAQGDPPALEQAVALYRGPLLEGCTEEWAFQERQVREQAYLAALESLAEHAMAAGEPAAAERHMRRVVALDPLRESAHRSLLRALAAGGSYAAAFQVYRELRLHLHRELNAEPDAETLALFEQIRAEARCRAGGRRPTTDDRPPTGGPFGSTPPPPHLTTSPSQHLTATGEGMVTFLFTDIEESTKLWEQVPEATREAMARHDALLRAVIEGHGGTVFKTVGDQFCAAFATAPDALAAAVAAQRALLGEAWSATGPLRVRMALYTGVVEERAGDYSGPTLNRTARLLDAAHGGQILLSLATREMVGDSLQEGTSLRDLGEHRLKDLLRPERIFQVVAPELQADFPPLRSLEASAHNLPTQLTSFVGREQEVAEVKELLATTRLLTLTGSGGCGKTRLALRVAASLVEEYVDGVWLVELAPLSDPALVPQRVASAVSVREEPGKPMTQTLVEALKRKKLLLVLDNCEHLLAASAALAEALLRGCPQVKILATSREGLNISGEAPYRLRSLTAPDPRQWSMEDGRWSMADGRPHRRQPSTINHEPSSIDHPPSALLQYEAVQLFVERATTVFPSFRLTDQNAAAIAQISCRLEGIPLAIELAAARVKALPVEKLNERLHDMFRLLTGGSRTALPRQQTLRALIDWSYDLLSEPERAVLRRLSVFAGGWTLEAAEAVCAGEGIEEWEILDLLSALVEKSLVLYEAREGEARYRLLEPMRQYARDRLLEGGEGEAVRGRHLGFFLQLAEEAELPSSSGKGKERFDRLEREHENLLAALEWCQEGEAGKALRLVGAMGGFWLERGYWSEGRQWLEQTLTRAPSAEPTVERARVLAAAGRLTSLQRDQLTARAQLEESIALYRVLGDARGLIWALDGLASVMRHLQGMNSAEARALMEEAVALGRSLGDPHILARALDELAFTIGANNEFQAARALWQESLALARRAGDEEAMAWSLLHMGEAVGGQGDWAAARDLMEQALPLARAAKHVETIGWTLSSLGHLHYRHGNEERAESLQEELLALGRAVGEPVWINNALFSLAKHASSSEEALQIAAQEGDTYAIDALVGAGHGARERGDYEWAATFYRRSLALRQELGDTYKIAQSLEHFAGLAARQQHWARAARLLGAAEGVCAGIDATPPVAAPEEYERAVTETRAALGEAAFTAAWAEGRGMTLEQAMVYASEEEDAA